MYKNGQIVINALPNGQEITCRVIEFIDSVQMFRITDARETDSDEVLIKKNKTAPWENLKTIDQNNESDVDAVVGIAQIITQYFNYNQVTEFLKGDRKNILGKTLLEAVREAGEFFEFTGEEDARLNK